MEIFCIIREMLNVTYMELVCIIGEMLNVTYTLPYILVEYVSNEFYCIDGSV